MIKTTKVLLLLALAGLVSGLLFVSGGLNSGGVVALHVLLPMGAVFFGLFLLCKVLEKETALHDEEQRTHLKAATNDQKSAAASIKPAAVPSAPGALRAH
jgi:hypothetical protein